MLKVRCDGRPRGAVTRQRFGIRVAVREKARNPCVKPVSASHAIAMQFSHRVFRGELLNLSDRAGAVGADLGGLIAPSAVGMLISKPVIRASISFVIGGHPLQHSAAKPIASMTISPEE